MTEHEHQLTDLLAPQGIITVTTGSGEVSHFLRERFGATDPTAVNEAWSQELARIDGARAILVGLPCDVGAGFERGSFKGPLAIRCGLLARGLYDAFAESGIVDLGDVRVNPQLLDDEYYRDELLDDVRRSRNAPRQSPVSPLTSLRAVLARLGELNPHAPVLVLGGDHSLSRIPVEVLMQTYEQGTVGILHFDAHTDLLETRDGVPFNFATWAYHANELIGRRRRLVQVGVRVSGRSREDWETDLDLVQIRMDEVERVPSDVLVRRIIEHFAQAGVSRLYISNDIDATDPTFAASTGTMESGGLHPDLVCSVIEAVGQHFSVVGSDLVEVAPPLKWHVPGEPARTIATASRYVLRQLEVMADVDLPRPFEDIEPATAAEVEQTPPWVLER